MENFETLLLQHRGPIERYVKFRIDHVQDAEDILQDTFLTGFRKFETLQDQSQFKFWMISIAKNKCRDYYRRKYRNAETPMDELVELSSDDSEFFSPVQETLEKLRPQDRAMLRLTYEYGAKQSEIAAELAIPVGTVKSRLHTAKQHFKALYPYHTYLKGDFTMKQMPLTIPEYTITPSAEAPFAVRYEEMPGWFIVPGLGEKLKWAMYEQPSKKRTMFVDSEAIGRTQIHGIEGVEIRCVEHNPVPGEQIGTQTDVERTFVAQLTATHCRILAEAHVGVDGVKKLFTFMDGDEFLVNWGYGPDNEGTEVALSPKGIMKRSGAVVAMAEPYVSQLLPESPMDIVGRYTVTIDGKVYDTVLLMLVETWNDGAASVMTETYIDANGRTILWRRFNRDDWAYHHFGKLWTEALPDNERVTINGQTYVHWYDCITDYILG